MGRSYIDWSILEVLSPTYEDELLQIKDVPLVKQPIDKINISGLMDDFVYKGHDGCDL